MDKNINNNFARNFEFILPTIHTPYISTYFYAVRETRALKMSTKELQKDEIFPEYGCQNLNHKKLTTNEEIIYYYWS